MGPPPTPTRAQVSVSVMPPVTRNAPALAPELLAQRQAAVKQMFQQVGRVLGFQILYIVHIEGFKTLKPVKQMFQEVGRVPYRMHWAARLAG